MKPAFPLLMIHLLFSRPAAAQEPDTGRISTHQSELDLHRWDVLKTHPSVPELEKGADLARRGDHKGAICAFQKAASKRKSMAYFNIGVVHFETGHLERALRYFRLSYRVRKDSLCFEYLENTRRLLNERTRRQ